MEIKRKEKEALLARLGARVRALRLEADLTVSAFAKRASLSPRFINKLEAGTGNISVARLAQVAAALGRALPELLPPPKPTIACAPRSGVRSPTAATGTCTNCANGWP